MKRDNKNKWISIHDELPQYYKIVLGFSNDERLLSPIVLVWRASDGDYDFYNVCETNLEIDIMLWAEIPKLP